MHKSQPKIPESEVSQLNADALDRISFQLSLLYRAGAPSEESLALLSEDVSAGKHRQALSAMAKGLGEGLSLSAAARETGIFPRQYLAMLEVGEASGNMDEVLMALSRYYRRQTGIQSALHRALVYPAVMAGLVLILFAVMLSQVLPVFARVFQQMGVALPPLARGLMSFGQASVYAAGVICVLLMGATFWFLSRRGQRGGLPVGRAANNAMDRGQFSYVMSMVLSSGLSFERGLDYAEELLRSSHLVERLRRCRQRMEDGLPFAKALEETGVLTPLQASLLAAGVRTGDAERAMDEVATRCAEESEEALSRFFTRLEFALVILLCASVGLVLLSVMLPLVGLLSAIG